VNNEASCSDVKISNEVGTVKLVDWRLWDKLGTIESFLPKSVVLA
jgi:hypothetical protein